MNKTNSTSCIVLTMLISGCTTATHEQQRASIAADGDKPTVLAAIEDNIRHDTLLIQTTFDMGDGTFVMVAGNVEPKFEGIRLYRYKLLPDSNAQILSHSTGGYDSWTMLPTFFSVPNPPGTHLVLANFGERESWGQKLLFMDSTFTDLGFLDVAYPEHIAEGDTTYVKRTNVAPFGRLALHGDTAVFTFACDSLFLYDDMAGHNDLIVPAHDIRYTYHPETGLELWRNGQRRAVKQPS
jgi:hypothetical protein